LYFSKKFNKEQKSLNRRNCTKNHKPTINPLFTSGFFFGESSKFIANFLELNTTLSSKTPKCSLTSERQGDFSDNTQKNVNLSKSYYHNHSSKNSHKGEKNKNNRMFKIHCKSREKTRFSRGYFSGAKIA